MTPVSRPWSTFSRSLRCRPRQIRFVTRYASGGTTKTSSRRLFVMSLLIGVGMWLERFVIIVTSLNRDFIPASWGMYYPTQWDFMTFFGTIGLFLTLFLLFLRFVPMISIFEVKMLLPQSKVKADHHAH